MGVLAVSCSATGTVAPVIKVLNNCSASGKYWVQTAAQSVQDTGALPCN